MVYTEDIFLAEKDGHKYIFIGKMDRVAYRIDMHFEKSVEEWQRLNALDFYSADKCQYLTTLHEHDKAIIPDHPQIDVRYIQDGYLPSNYSSYYLRFKPSNVQYYAWDKIGKMAFEAQGVPVSIMPFRKKLYMPIPNFKRNVKNVLVATSGSGDWTALKNRSDDDLMVMAFVKLARIFPNINFIYRCHPTWIHPQHVGVNSINRVMEYFNYTGLKNIWVSGNIPKIESMSNFPLTFKRSSLQSDLETADIVFGEHSVSMLDASFEKIPFCSVNLTKRRNFTESLTNMGFPHCQNIDDLVNLIRNIGTIDFQRKYINAVNNYNLMTLEDE